MKVFPQKWQSKMNKKSFKSYILQICTITDFSMKSYSWNQWNIKQKSSVSIFTEKSVKSCVTALVSDIFIDSI